MFCITYFFCIKDTATTEIYTYVHTRSQHDALPIGRSSRRRLNGKCGLLEGPQRASKAARQRGDTGARQARRRAAATAGSRPDHLLSASHPRSEEHTSELQSLMRISYAVFCLKKNTNTPHTSTITTHIHEHIE